MLRAVVRMTAFILGVIVGACAMWLLEWVRSKPASPLLQLQVVELRMMLDRAVVASQQAHAQWVQERLLSRPGVDAERTYHRLLDDVVMLRDALRVVEARETPEARGPYR